MPNTIEHSIAPTPSPAEGMRTRRRNWFGLPVLRLTTLIPAALSLVVFFVTLLVAWVAADFVHRNNLDRLVEKAQIVLDATAGHFTNIDTLTEGAVAEALGSALSFRTVVGEEALAVGWMRNGALRAIGAPTTATGPLRQDLMAALQSGGTSAFEIGDDFRAVLARSYGEGERQFVLAGVFDTEDLFAANDALHSAAIGLSLLMSIATALASYLLGRIAISPLVALANRLAEGGTGDMGAMKGLYLSSEILEIETILALRREDDKTRESLARRLAQVERDQVLARLAATLAHEVRNPLAGIRNAFSTLRRFGSDKAAREETLDIIENGLDSLQRLTDVTLSTYRRRAGAGVITALDMKDLALVVSPQVEQKALVLEWDIADTITFIADTDAVRQMLVNLLLNACKASPEGGVVKVSASADEEGVRISIADSGTGLPEGIRRHLHAGVAPSVHDSRDLGLWVVHSLADELGASVSIESQIGRGTIVSVLLPAAGKGTANE
jgi:signal transduction histidine kinase